MTMLSRRRTMQALSLATLATSSLPLLAQDPWRPLRPIRVVVPFPPGGGGDVLTRLIARNMEDPLGQAVIVENKPGASGAIGSESVYRAAPSGYTLLSGSQGAQAMYPHVSQVGFDAAKFVPIGGIAQMGYVLMGRADLPATNIAELLALMERKTLSYGSGGAGSSPHVYTELFLREAGRKMLHIPYQGAGPSLQALLGGQIDLMMVPLAQAPQYRGKLRSYGVTSAYRVDAVKEVPTFAEQGLNVVGEAWAAFFAPPGAPEPVVEALASALRRAVVAPEVQQKLRDLGMTPMTMSRKDFAQFYAVEYRRWGEVIKFAQIRAE